MAQRGVPQLDGRPDYAGDHRSDRAELAEASTSTITRWRGHSESLAQWVLEDSFTLGRLPWRTVGVQLVRDRQTLRAHETAAAERLASGHELSGHPLRRDMRARGVHDPLLQASCTADIPSQRGYTRRCSPCRASIRMRFVEQLIARFSSQGHPRALARQVVDGSDRIPKFLLPVVRNSSPPVAALTMRRWC